MIASSTRTHSPNPSNDAAAASAEGEKEENKMNKKKKMMMMKMTSARQETSSTRDPYKPFRKKWKTVPGELYPTEVQPSESWGFITNVVCGSASSFAINGRGWVVVCDLGGGYKEY